MVELGVNIDHVATIRQARRGDQPDPVAAAVLAELSGADSITVHLREDRRHIQDRDVRLLRETISTKMNFELSCAKEVVQIACETRPAQATLVPERREEVTTEGGLDILKDQSRVVQAIEMLKARDIFVSLFLDPDEDQIRTAVKLGADAVELHTGQYASERGAEKDRQLKRLVAAGRLVREVGLQLHAGHGLDYQNVQPVAAIPEMRELNIGHSIVSRAVMVGMREAVSEMKRLLNAAVK
ncbi:MAG: Pyridoxine 5-phosphate synthase [Planctomycetota bacterium]|jgi:pyridoxine 5-phosphate synthase